MNTKAKSLALITAMMIMNQPMPLEKERVIKKDTSYLRKKCKSCAQFAGKMCQIKRYIKPLDSACDQYEPRRK